MFKVTAYADNTKARSFNPERPITIYYTPEEVGEGDFLLSSIAGVATTVILDFSANGIWKATFSVPLANDNTIEQTGKIRVTLNEDQATFKTYDISTRGDHYAEATILDDDAPEISISVSSANATVAEAANAKAKFTITASAMPTSALTIHYTPVSNFITNSGTKTTANIPVADFTKRTVMDDDGISVDYYDATLEVAIDDDNLNEPNGKVTVTLANESVFTSYAVGSPASAMVAVTDNDIVPTLMVSSGSRTVAESDGELTIPVTLSNPSTAPVEITYNTRAGTASVADFENQVNSTLRIEPSTQSTSNTTGTIRIPITDDELDEEDESFNLSISYTRRLRDFSSTTSTTSINVTITDNDSLNKPVITFAETPTFVLEGETANTSITLTANLDKPSGKTVTAKYSTTTTGITTGAATGTTGSGIVQDFVGIATPTTLSFAPGETQATFDIEIKKDDENEGNETFKVTLNEAANGAFEASATSIEKTITIIDNDSPTLSFKTSNFKHDETDSNTTFEVVVELSESTTNPVAFDIALTDGTTTKGTDYTEPQTTNYTIPATQAGQTANTEVTISIPITGDTTNEGNETFDLTLLNLTGASFASGIALTQTLTIVDDENPIFGLAEANVSVTEDAGMVDLIVNLSGAKETESVSIGYNTETQGATATVGSDYTEVLLVTANDLVIPAGQTTGTIQIPILNDDTNEPNETFTVLLTARTGVEAPALNQRKFTVTILDDDLPELSITGISNTKEAANATAEFRISTDIRPHSTLEINYLPESASFLADTIAGEKQTSQPLTFFPADSGNSYITTLSVPIENDQISEPNGTIKVTLQAEDPDMNNYKVHTTNNHATVNVGDDDGKVPVLFIAGSVDGVFETADSIEFVITAYDDQVQTNSIDPGRNLTVQFTPEELVSNSFLTNAGSAMTSELTFEEINGVWTDTITLDINQDSNSIASGTIKVTLNDDPAPFDAYTVASGTRNSASISIWDENIPSLTIVAGHPVTEGGDEKATFKVISNVAPNADLSVQYTPEGADFITGSGTKVTATPAIKFVKNNLTGKFEGLIEVDILDNSIYDPNGLVSVTLSNETTPTTYYVNSPATASVQIIDNDPIPTLSIANLTPSVTEGDTSITIPVTLSSATSEVVTYHWATTALSASANDFTVKTNESYTIAGNTTGTVQMQLPIPITDDNYKENNETFTINLTRPRNAVFLNNLDTYTITVTINDNEGATQISFANTTYRINESAGTLTVRANLNHIPNQTVSAKYSTADDSAISTGENADFAAVTNQLFSFPAGKDFTEFTITINDDAVNEPNERFMISLSEPVNAVFANSATSISTTTTITDNDLPTLALKTQSFNAPEEGGNSSVDVELLGTVRQAVTFDIALGGGTASKLVDYNDPAITRYTIPLGSTETTISIPILSDTLNEGNESFDLTLSNLTGAIFAEGTSLTQAITIVDDEVPILKFTNPTIAVAENVTGGMANLEISLSGATTNPVSVTYATANGLGFLGAVAGSDFTAPTANFNSATIAVGQLTGTIQIPIINDAIDEPHKIFTVTISNPQNAVLSSTSADLTMTVTIQDDEVPELTISAGDGVTEGPNTTANFTITADIIPYNDLVIHYLPVSRLSATTTELQTLQTTTEYAPTSTSYLATGISASPQVSLPLRFTLVDADDSTNTTATTTLSLPIKNDEILEVGGTVKVTLRPDSPANTNYKVHRLNNNATLSVTDDDIPEFKIRAGRAVVESPGATADFIISTEANLNRKVTVKYNLAETANFIAPGR